MNKIKKLPDAEFEVMKAIWAIEPPANSFKVMEHLGSENKWTTPVIITFMQRLVDRGFLSTEKIGRDRFYYPLIRREDYLKFETCNFIKQYHENSFINLINTLNDDKALSEKDIDELFEWVKERKG